MALTGRFQFRRSFGGRIVLQVEEEKIGGWFGRGALRRRYRDANLMDLAMPELRALIDLRQRPFFLTPPLPEPAEAPHAPRGAESGVADQTADLAPREGAPARVSRTAH